MSGVILGGETAWKVRAVGDLVVAYHWIKDEPSMLIYPRYRRLMLSKAVPWALPLSGAHELVLADSKGHGVNTKELLAKAERCAQCMGIHGDRQAIMRIADLILAGLDDLINMPPTPARLLKQDQGIPGDGVMQLRENGKVIVEREV